MAADVRITQIDKICCRFFFNIDFIIMSYESYTLRTNVLHQMVKYLKSPFIKRAIYKYVQLLHIYVYIHTHARAYLKRNNITKEKKKRTLAK